MMLLESTLIVQGENGKGGRKREGEGGREDVNNGNGHTHTHTHTHTYTQKNMGGTLGNKKRTHTNCTGTANTMKRREG